MQYALPRRVSTTEGRISKSVEVTTTKREVGVKHRNPQTRQCLRVSEQNIVRR